MQNQQDKSREAKNTDKADRKDQNNTYGKAGSEETGALPNDPAENAKKTSPEEDAGKKEDTRLSADS